MMTEIKLPELKILSIKKLYPHEELNIAALRTIRDSMKLGVFTNPIIVDKNTHVILDGMHRYELLLDMKYELIPCQLVDYLSDDIEVKSWFPTAYMKGDINGSIDLIKELARRYCGRNGIVMESVQKASNVLSMAQDSSRPCLWGIIFPESSRRDHIVLRLRDGAHELYEITGLLKKFTDELEGRLRKEKIGYLEFHADEKAKYCVDVGDEVELNRKTYHAVCTLCRPAVRKDEVLDWALKRKLLPKKSTRHIIKNCRALYINIPFSHLKGRKVTEERANAELNRLIGDHRHIHRLYVEPIYIYDELMYELTKSGKKR